MLNFFIYARLEANLILSDIEEGKYLENQVEKYISIVGYSQL